MGAHRRALHGHLRECAARRTGSRLIARTEPVASAHSPAASEMQIDHFLSMCDDTGLFQHAVHSVPDRAHGYCVDDNARALAVGLRPQQSRRNASVRSADGALCRLCAACVESRHQAVSQFHGLQPNAGSKTAAPKTAMGERCGRWASARAGTQARRGADGPPPCLPRHCRPSRPFVRPARGLSRCSVWTPIAPLFPMIARASEIRHSLADRLMSSLASVETPDWVWFEEGLAYDNARLPQALMLTGMATANTRLSRRRVAIPALADDATNDVDGSFPPHWHRRLW